MGDMNDEVILITTASGATYHLCGSELVRLRGDDSAPLRADGDPCQVLDGSVPVVGERWALLLAAGAERPFTRVTSPVVSIDLVRHDDDPAS